jgi:hypothetical protein
MNAYPADRRSHCGIDSGGGKMGLDGSRTDEVYRWCNRDPVRLFALKGESEPKDSVLRTRRVVYQPPDQKRSPYVVFLHLIDSGHFNDLLASSIETKLPVVNPATGEVTDQEVDQWELNDFNDDDYNRQMANVHKVRMRKRGKPVERWIEKTAGARHDYRDCEKYQQAMAHGPANCAGLPSAEAIAQQRKLEQLAREPGAEADDRPARPAVPGHAKVNHVLRNTATSPRMANKIASRPGCRPIDHRRSPRGSCEE